MVLRVMLFLVFITHHLMQVRVVDSGLVRLLWTLISHLLLLVKIFCQFLFLVKTVDISQ